jgi:hypothetical protein
MNYVISRVVERGLATAAMVGMVAIGTGAKAFAQPADPNFQQQSQQYQDQQQQYQQQQDAYQAQKDAYARQHAAYRDRQETYQDQRADYAAARAAYDARWGAGSFDTYVRTHTTTTTTYSPAGDVESRSQSTVVESPAR